MVKTMKFIVKNAFDGLKGCICEGKGIKKTSQMRSKPIRKSMNNRYKNYARKKGSQKMKHHPNSHPKRI